MSALRYTAQSVGGRVRELREDRGMAQAELARRASAARGSGTLHRQGLYAIESGRKLPGLEILVALADALGVSLDELVGRHINPP